MCYRSKPFYLLIDVVVPQHMNAYMAAVTGVTKRMHFLAGLPGSDGISSSMASSEQAYRLELSVSANRIHGEVQTFLRVRELYLNATESLLLQQ